MSDAAFAPWALDLPASPEAIAQIHSARKPLAVERALASPFMRKRLAGLDLADVNDPETWARIPPLTKDELRKLTAEEFYGDFCIAGAEMALEYWRSGGATGKPLFYPRSAEDMRYAMGVAFRRIWPCVGATPKDVIHVAFPMGIHPVGQLTPRSAEMEGIGTVWAGSGTTTPSAIQLELILSMKPTILAAMPSYALHLANVAVTKGIDLANSSVTKVVTSAEPLTAAKRAKLEREWGARVYNGFGMTEGSMTAVERDGLGGMAAFTDLFYLEVVDPASGKVLGPGAQGALLMTPMFSNTMTPFLRWLTGDIVTLQAAKPRTDDPYSVFPVLEHGLRTEGFFKVRGVNINHGDLEDFMFEKPAVLDFRAEVLGGDGLDSFRLEVELRPGAESDSVAAELTRAVKETFEISAEIAVLEPGTLGRAFEGSVKAPRFVDRR